MDPARAPISGGDMDSTARSHVSMDREKNIELIFRMIFPGDCMVRSSISDSYWQQATAIENTFFRRYQTESSYLREMATLVDFLRRESEALHHQYITGYSSMVLEHYGRYMQGQPVSGTPWSPAPLRPSQYQTAPVPPPGSVRWYQPDLNPSPRPASWYQPDLQPPRSAACNVREMQGPAAQVPAAQGRLTAWLQSATTVLEGVNRFLDSLL